MGFLRSILSFAVLIGLFISQLQPYLSGSALEKFIGYSLDQDASKATLSDKYLLEKSISTDLFHFLAEIETSEKAEESDESEDSDEEHTSQYSLFSRSLGTATLGLTGYHSLLSKTSKSAILIKDALLLFKVLRI